MSGNIFYQITSGSLPPGLSMNTGGLITGTPTFDPNEGSGIIYRFGVSATDVYGNTSYKPFALNVRRRTGSTITPNVTTINEGSSVTFFVSVLGIDDATLYWTVESVSGFSSGDVTAASGSIAMTNRSGSFTVTATADFNTEAGAETFRVNLRRSSTSGTILATSDIITINDTSQTPNYNYAFTPLYSSSTGGSGVAPGAGLPGDYNSSTYGDVIWPIGGSGRWVGISFVPTGNTINFRGTSDNYFALYLNQSTLVTSHGDWSSWRDASISVIPGVTHYLSAYVENYGGPYGFVARVTQQDGSLITTTNFNWVSN